MSRANPRFRRQNPKLPAPLNNVYRLRVFGTIENQMTVTTFYFRDALGSGTATLTHMTNLQTAVAGAGNLLSKLPPCMSSDWTETQYIIDVPTSPSLAALVTANPVPGTGPAGHEPTEVAAVFTRYTAFKGQCGRGRFSLPAVPTTWVTASKVTTLTAYNALAANMTAVITGGTDTFTPALYSRNGSRAFPGSGEADLVSCVFNPLLGTIRRRKIGRGK